MIFKQNLKNVVDGKQKVFLVILLFGSIFLSLFEMIGIGSIGIFVAILSDSQSFIEKIPFESLQSFLSQFKINKLIILFGIALTLVFLFKNLLIVIYKFFELRIKNKINLDISKKIYSEYLHRDISFHNNKNPAELVNIVNSVTNSASLYIFTIINFIKEIFLIFFLISGLFVINFKLSLYLLLAILIVSSILYISIKNFIKKLGKDGIEIEKNILKSLNEGLGGIKIIKTLKNYNFFVKEFKNLKSKQFDMLLIVQILALLPKLLLEIFAVACTAVLTIFLLKTNLTFVQIIPILTVISLILVRMIPSFSNINTALQHIRYMGPHYDTVSRELTNKIDKSSEENVDEKITVINGEIDTVELRDLTFSYGKKNILDKANIELKKGQFIGLIGETGTGKTTLVDIILGLLKPEEGKIVINKLKETLNFSFLTKYIGYVPQDIYLADCSIAENIAFGEEESKIDIGRIKKSLKLSQLNEFINSSDDDIFSKVGDRGVRISGGQKQRIGIARALYRNPKILIMDESTNSLDSFTEENFIKDVKNISKEMIVLFITHRTSTLRFCDKIYKLENCKIIEQ
tara:strand:+ start:185 stop:1909 length:1725 start_codon:yes stop_codon:yes gene_type:complete